MNETVMISITEKEEGLEVRIAESAYGNLALVGLLERLKLSLLETFEEETPIGGTIKTRNSKYDA
jgi:hypothetical protein